MKDGGVVAPQTILKTSHLDELNFRTPKHIYLLHKPLFQILLKRFNRQKAPFDHQKGGFANCP